mmetsp:Transcript_109265/g.309113  ORF Transcript_109265/g.309113 Transcript_109265/m.309113 type:complete len:225 (-) Transcript_109265:82-756(-)
MLVEPAVPGQGLPVRHHGGRWGRGGPPLRLPLHVPREGVQDMHLGRQQRRPLVRHGDRRRRGHGELGQLRPDGLLHEPVEDGRVGRDTAAPDQRVREPGLGPGGGPRGQREERRDEHGHEPLRRHHREGRELLRGHLGVVHRHLQLGQRGGARRDPGPRPKLVRADTWQGCPGRPRRCRRPRGVRPVRALRRGGRRWQRVRVRGHGDVSGVTRLAAAALRSGVV